MAADIQIREYNGTQGAEVGTDKTGGTIRAKNADNATVDNADPLIIPTSNTEYSFEKFIQAFFNTAPSVEITNLEAFMDGTNNYGTGIKAWYRILASYTTPAVPTETNDPPQVPVGGTPVAAADLFALTSASPGALGAGPHTGTGQKGSFILVVMEAETTASQGALTAETFTLRYSEI
jgi:hypothetical protein